MASWINFASELLLYFLSSSSRKDSNPHITTFHSMKKESLGLAIYERLTSNFEDWSNQKYGDNPRPDELLQQLRKNLMSEVEAAWEKFISNK